MLFPDIPVMDNILIYIAVGFLLIAFLIISIRPKKKISIFSDEDDVVRKEMIQEEYAKLVEKKQEERIQKEKEVQLSIFHKNYPEEIKDIITIEDMANKPLDKIVPIVEEPDFIYEDYFSEDEVSSIEDITVDVVDAHIIEVKATTDIPDEKDKQEIVEKITEILEAKIEEDDESEETAWAELVESPDDVKVVGDFFTDAPIKDFSTMTVKELRSAARALGLVGYTKMRKSELIEFLIQNT